ncbi:MAG: UTP--glucose-1-phosphate uridylyltransferase GalU [Peptostreptococcaceae bacterium]|nr:UTP--glucose-1-phosphate uridylyltransferase GalU [Peptostreptococcaceae bacterium]
MKVKKAVIPAAGLGTRFLPATKAVPKEMLNIVDKPALQYIVEEVVASGIEEILIITTRNKETIQNHFDKSFELEIKLAESGKTDMLREVVRISEMADIHYVRQKEPKGLGHAIGCAKTFVGNEPFAVLLGDDIVYNEGEPCLRQLLNVYEAYGDSVLGVQTVPHEETYKYGIIAGKKIKDRTYRVTDMVEKPGPGEAPSDMAILGRYVLDSDIFEMIERTPRGKGGEIQLTDAMKMLLQSHRMLAYDFVGRRYDTGNKQGYLEATVEYALRHPEIKSGFMEYLKHII